MIQFVIGFNVVLALCGFYVAWRIWRVKRVLTAATATLTAWERNTHWALDPKRTPELILRGQQSTAALRARYAHLERQLEQVQRIFSLVLLGLRWWQRRGRLRRKPLRLR